MNPQLPWFALQVRSQREASVADHLAGNGYELLLPLYKLRKRWSDRIREIDAPLFPGYLFCRLNPHDRLPILKTPGVLQIVGFKDGPSPIDEQEICAVRNLVASGAPSQPWPFLQIGDKVRIESGPLCGLVGILIQFRGKHRLIVSVTLLQRAVAAEVDSALVTPQPTERGHRLERVRSQPLEGPLGVSPGLQVPALSH